MNMLCIAVNTLLATFESLFLDCILYPQEREAYEQTGLIRELRKGLCNGEPLVTVDPLRDQTKGCMYHHFGAVHLLRLLVLVVLKKGVSSEGGVSVAGGGGSNKKRKAHDIEGGTDTSTESASFSVPDSSEEVLPSSVAGKEERDEMLKFSQSVLELLETHEFFPNLR
jgi:hypothetical protein